MDDLHNNNINPENDNINGSSSAPSDGFNAASTEPEHISNDNMPPENVPPVNNSANQGSPADMRQPTQQYTYTSPAAGYQPGSQYQPPRPPYQGYQSQGAYTYHSGAYSQPNVPVQNAPTPPYAAAVPENSKKHTFSVLTLIACILVSAILATVISSAVTMSIVGKNNTSSGTSSVSGNVNTTITNTSDNYVEAVAKKVQPSVVGIVTKYTYTTQGFFGSNTSEAENEGSGVIYTADGYIITNKHVIDSAVKYGGEVYVYLPSDLETAYKATIIGYDASVDLAVLKIDATNLPLIEIGSSKNLVVGQNAVAVGNPGGMGFIGSVSVGYISGLDRKVTIDSTTMSLIQTDSAINPGNSGGALVDSEGKLIGITNAKLVSEEFEGMGFAIPVDTVTEICDGIIAGKDEPKPYIGVQINTSYTADILKRYGMPAGAVVNSVVDGGPAAQAGIQKGDIIVAIDDTDITSYDILVSAINKHKVGDTVTVRVYRNKDYINLKLTLTANS